MTWLLPRGPCLKFKGLDTPLRILKGIGSGSQGQVYVVELDKASSGQLLALKWYFPSCIARDPGLHSRLRQSIRFGSPNADFLWPLATLESQNNDFCGIGYLMPLRPPSFVGSHLHAVGDLEISLQNVLKACFRLAEAFHQLHLKGLCYKDISLGNIFLEPSTGRILICDNDNVDIDGQRHGTILGTPGFIAPEVLLGKALPGASSDLFSLAVLLFRLLTRHDPFRGARELEIRCLDEPARRCLYAEEALFIFDPINASNRPDPIEHIAALITWPIYPRIIQKLFERSLSLGLRQPEQRSLTGQWKQALAQCLDQRQLCPHCGQEVFCDAEEEMICWSCRGSLPNPTLLKLPHGVVYASAGNELHPHHFDVLSGETIDHPIAVIVPHPSVPSLLGLKNLSRHPWQVSLINGQQISLEPGKTSNLASTHRLDSHMGTVLVICP